MNETPIQKARRLVNEAMGAVNALNHDDPRMTRARRISALSSLARTWIDRAMSNPNASAEALTAGEALQEAIGYIQDRPGAPSFPHHCAHCGANQFYWSPGVETFYCRWCQRPASAAFVAAYYDRRNAPCYALTPTGQPSKGSQ